MDNEFKFLIDAGLDDDAKKHLQDDIKDALKQIKDLELEIPKARLSKNAEKQLINTLQNLQTLTANVEHIALNDAAKTELRSAIGAVANLTANIDTAKLDPQFITNLQGLLNNLGGLTVNVTGVNINNSQLAQQAQHAGQQIGKQIQTGIQSAIQKGVFETSFGIQQSGKNLSANDINRTVGTIKAYFEGLNKGTVSVSENMKQWSNGTAYLDGLTVSINRTDGAIEKLNYRLKEGKFFYSDGSINDSGIIKQFNAIERTIVDYEQRFAQFKSTNRDILSGLSVPLQQFEVELANLKNGAGSIDAVKNSFLALKKEENEITGQLTGQLGKTAAAARNLNVGSETINKLMTDFKGLSNAPKDVKKQLEGLSTKLAEIKQIETSEGTSVNWATKYREWKKELDSVTAKIRVLQNEEAKLSSNQIISTSDLKKSGRAYMTKVNRGVDGNFAELQKIANTRGWQKFDVSGIEKADGMVKQLTVTFTDATGAIKRFVMQRDKIDTGQKVYNGLIQVGDVQIIKSATVATRELQEAQEKSLKNLQTKLSNGTYSETEINRQIDALKKYGVTVDQAEQQVKELRSALLTMSDSNASAEQRINAEERWRTALGQTKNVVTAAKLEWQGLATIQQRLTKANTIEAFLQKNTRITKEARDELERYVASLRDVDTAMSKVAKNNIDIRFKEIENSMRGLHKLGYAFSDQMKQAATSFAQWISVSNLIMSGIYRTREAVNELIEVDNILTEISKTSDMTKQELIALGDESFETASKLGRNATDYLNTVMDMSRSGFYGEQGEAMANQVLLAQTAGDLSQELASNYVIATNAAYKFGGDVAKINKVIDGANLITNRYSVAMADMAESMSIAGTVAASYRVNPDELSAMTGVIESVTKLGGNEVGNAIKAIFINLQNITSSKIVGTLSKAGASMTEVVNGVQQMRNPVEILKDLAVTFNSLDEKDPLRAEILTNIGQKYHAQKLAALLSNMDKYDEMLVTYAQGTGSAAIEAEKSANNIQGSLNRLSNTWTDIINNMLSSDTMLLGINTLNEFLTLLNSATGALGDLGSIGMLATGIASAKGYGLNHSLQPLFIKPYIMPYGQRRECFGVNGRSLKQTYLRFTS